MQIFAFDLFIASCLWLLIWGMLKPDRVLQYPFFMGAIFFAFLVPQATALLNNPGAAPLISVYRILIYGALCAIMCSIGYRFKPKEQWLAKLDGVINPKRLFYSGLFLAAFGTLCQLSLGVITIQTTSSGIWTGPATIIYLLASTIWPGISVLLLYGLYWRKPSSLILAALAASTILPAIIDSGRRQTTATLVILLCLGLFFTRRIIPPRFLVLLVIFITTFLILLFAQMRGGFWNSLFTGELVLEDFRNAYAGLQEGKILELRNAALITEYAELTGQYGYGTGFWNDIVFQYVPAQWFGRAFKDSLYLRLTRTNFQDLFYYQRPTGTTSTGLGDSFAEFSYFGCFIFGFIGYFFKHLWISAVYRTSIYSQILYMGLVSSALIAVTHGIGRFINEAIFQFICLLFIIRFSREKDDILHAPTPNNIS
jgi:hypothetical protein